jgi:hypothetical protein
MTADSNLARDRKCYVVPEVFVMTDKHIMTQSFIPKQKQKNSER